MYLQRIYLRAIRSFADLRWALPAGAAAPGWHVILGDNGSGKSTFLRAIAMTFIDANERAALRQSWDEWLRDGCDKGLVSADFVEGTTQEGSRVTGGFRFELLYRDADFADVAIIPVPGDDTLSRRQWFSASYGPFRRFGTTENDLAKFHSARPAAASHLSLFGESDALTAAIAWLKDLKFKKFEGNADGALLDPILSFVNQQGFLPHDVRIGEVTSNGVVLVDSNGFNVPLQAISDGYLSVLSMTFDLIWQMALSFGPAKLFSSDYSKIICPGVVLIDEIDAHLHPTWQRTIGLWFRAHFPNIQFIVSTHSPLICQAAEIGSVFRLPLPGSDPDEDQGEMLSGMALNRLLYGNVLDAYSTGAFGDGGEPSKRGQAKLERLAKLNIKELTESLTEGEKAEQDELRAILPTEASTTQSS
jgi:energy-coupling factor transporter ATP-binding protein EcfA2